MDGQMIHEAMFDQTESTYNVLDIWIVGWPAMFGTFGPAVFKPHSLWDVF